jgi:hypothetical protein
MTNSERQTLDVIVLLITALDSSESLATELANVYKQRLVKHEIVQHRLAIAAWQAHKGYKATAYEMLNEAIQYLVLEAGGLDTLAAKLTLTVGEDKAKTVSSQCKIWADLLSDGWAAAQFHSEYLA